MMALRRRLFWSCCFWALVTASSASNAQASKSQDLIDWIRSLEGGIYDSRQEERSFGNKQDNDRGVFAAQSISEGEILLQVPWTAIVGSKAPPETESLSAAQQRLEMMAAAAADLEEDRRLFLESTCRATHSLLAEVALGEASNHAPHLRYLGFFADEGVPPPIPSVWSPEGAALLEDINDHGKNPPRGLFTVLNHDWYGVCIEDIHDPIQKKVAATVAFHSGSGKLFSRHNLMVPLLDNHHYNQRQAHLLAPPEGSEHHGVEYYCNAQIETHPGEFVRLVATRDIQKGEQIFRAFDNLESDDDDAFSYTTPDIFRNLGIVDTTIYPKYYTIKPTELDDENDDENDDEELGIIVDEVTTQDGSSWFEVRFTHDFDEDWEWDAIERDLVRRVHQLEQLRVIATSHGTEHPPSNTNTTQYEWDTAWKYHGNLLEFMELALHQIRSIGDDDENENDNATVCPGGHHKTDNGSCPIWDGVEDLPTGKLLLQMDLEFNPDNPYGPTESAYDFCNDEEVVSWHGYDPIGEEEFIKSPYQEIQFIRHPETHDTVMKLDGTVQQSSGYRPHYHEFAVHFPARFLETVERVLFVGGGDSMVLHEVLKYPSLNKVVGLELDQYVLRNSFRYFNTQPHFDDKRVEWWFGDGAKSLLMLPKDYFQSFDLVVVDLSETVMSFQVTEKLSIFQTLSLLLKPEGIMLKNGEYYMDKMSRYFDYTLQYFEYNVPFICDQGMVIGSNSIDFFNRSMKDHGVELLVLESQEEINEKFNEYYRFTEYRKNDARHQGQCDHLDDDDDDAGASGGNAGILMVVEAENINYDFESSIETTEANLSEVLSATGFSVVSTVTNGKDFLVGVLREGYVTAHLVPENSYIGFDIKLWGNFDLMETAKTALVKAFSGTEASTSSFRIVTGGMHGTASQQTDRRKIGPRVVQNRNCEKVVPPSSPSKKRINLVQRTIEETFKNTIEDTNGASIAVLCGARGEPCESLDMLSTAIDQGSKTSTIVPIYTCNKLAESNAQFSPDIATRMTDCTVEVSKRLSHDTIQDKISLMVIDDSANPVMGKVLLNIFSSVWNRKRLFSSNRFLILADTSNTSEEAWRRNLLVKIREKVNYKPMSMADIGLHQNTELSARVSVLSLHDPDFFLHLKEIVEGFNAAYEIDAGAVMKVEHVYDGLVKPQVGHYRPKWFKANDYDPVPAIEQQGTQVQLGRQSVIQFNVKSATVPVNVLQKAIQSAIGVATPLEFQSFQDSDGIGDGLMVVGMSSNGSTHVVVTWDGKNHMDVNLFSKDASPRHRKKFVDLFTVTLGKIELKLSDTHPRGVGRVVSFPGDMN